MGSKNWWNFRLKSVMLCLLTVLFWAPVIAQEGDDNDLEEDEPNRLFVEHDWLRWPASKANADTVKKLVLDGIDDFDPELLKPFSSLKGLIIKDTPLNDLRFLRYFPHLTILELEGNSLNSAEGIQASSNLEELAIASNFLTSALPLKGLLKLRKLRLYDNDITDISPLSALKNLTSLDLGNNQFTTIEPLKDFIQLKLFSVYQCTLLTNINVIRNFKQVNDLNISLLNIPDFSLEMISGMTGIKNLRIQGMVSSNRELDYIKNMVLMEQLTMGINSNVTMLDSLWRMKNLKYLDIHWNHVKSIEVLRSFHKMIKIVMYENQVEDISPLEGCPQIKSLFMFHNPVKDYSPVYRMRNLQYLHVSLSDFDAIKQQQLRHRLPSTKISFF